MRPSHKHILQSERQFACRRIWILLVLAVAVPPMSGRAQETAPAPQPSAPAPGKPDELEKLLDLPLEQLAQTPITSPASSGSPMMDTPVTSVTKEASTIGRSPAAVFVITNEMIRRSGATNIPDALRMVPGMEVAQVNSNTWAVTARGFNSAYANKMLVLIDGRSVYNPDFSGVYWSMQDVLLEDVERIEVIRGPGGTLWGANAVNGVINVITKNAKDTQGAYLTGGGGSHERTLDAFRYGGQFGEDLNYRVYGKYFDRGPDFDPANQVNDAWQQGRFGFRTDWLPDQDKSNALTVQGDHFVGNTANSIIPLDFNTPERQTGENLLMRWRHVYDEDSDWALQTYYDKFSRGNDLQMETVKTFDVDFQYRFPLGDRQKITCGANFRNVESLYAGGDQFTNWFPYPYFTTNYTGQFVQDEIAIIEDRVTLTLGTKLEQNPYTGLEYQPSVRILWTPDQKHSAWAAVSRAVRTPSRAEEQFDGTFTAFSPGVYPRVLGSTDLVSEDMMAYEIGYREQTTDKLSWDIATFYNQYQHLIGAVQGVPFPEPFPPPFHVIVPMQIANGPSGDTYGVELATTYAISERWRLSTQYTCLQMHVESNPATVATGFDPQNQVYLHSAWDLSDKVEFDLTGRYVDSLAFGNIPSYITMDLRLAWRPKKHLELAVVGQNLLQTYHYEFPPASVASPAYSTEVPRGVYGTVTWRH
jgi:iron complex outermembrane recepter protein